MKFSLSTAEIFIPDGLPVEAGLTHTAEMAISGHQDDTKIMAANLIWDGSRKWSFGSPAWWVNMSPNFYWIFPVRSSRIRRSPGREA